MISHIVLKMKTTTLEELVQVLEPLEIHIEEDNTIQWRLIFDQFWVNEYRDSIQWLSNKTNILCPLCNELWLASYK